MREFSSTEIHLFNSFQDVKDPIQTPSFGAGQDSLFSIEKLTEDFITGLQNDFPATIPTIFRTGDKFHVTKDTLADLHEIDNACLMCQGILDTQTVNPCSLQATKFSQMVSLKGPENLKENQLLSAAIVKLNLDDLSASSGKGETVENGCEKEKSSCSGEGLCSDGGGGCGSKGSASPNVRLALSEIEAFLCYSCRILAAKLDHLPDFLEKEAGKKLRRAGMKHEIQDFLL